MNAGVYKDGTSQLDRIPRAASDYFHLDEMAFEQLLSMAVDYTKLLRFHRSNDLSDAQVAQEQNYWEDIFLADEAPVIAQILTTNLAKFDADFRKVLVVLQHNHFKLSGDYDPNQLPTYRLAKMLNAWFVRLRVIEGNISRSFSQQLGGMITQDLAHELFTLSGYLEQFNTNIPDIFRKDFHQSWFTLHPEEERSHFEITNDEEAERFLRGNFHAFYKALALLKNAAAVSLSNSLESKEHSPAVGLFMSFLKLFRKVQGTINRFTERHLDFYYHDVLKLNPRMAEPDRTYLLFSQDTSKRHVLVQKGTTFSAGLDKSSRDIIFAADNDVLISKTRIGALRTLYFESNPLISPEKHFGFVTSGKTNSIPLPGDIQFETTDRAWPLLGAPKEKTHVMTSVDAKLGFALSSPILLLQEGIRDITLSFDFEQIANHDTDNIFGDWLTKLADLTKTRILEELQETDDISAELDTFYKTFRDMFCISLTTEQGWLQVKEYLPQSMAIAPDNIDHSLVIKIRLPSEAAPITPYNSAIHGKGYDAKYPIIRFELNPASYLYPYSLLSKLNLHTVDIEVAVTGVKNVLIYNHLGQLDAKTPFNPFGPIPALGSYFLVGSEETAQKHLTDLEVKLEWGDLPSDKDGFAGHYADYKKKFDNDVFEVAITALKGGKWHPLNSAEHPKEKLFASKDSETEKSERQKISKNSMLSCQSVVALSIPSEKILNGEPLAYTQQTRDGFFKFTLSAPEHAFGHKEYPSLLTRVLTENARFKKVKYAKPTPRAPYTPLIESIELDYRAGVTINMDHANLAGGVRKHEKMYHIHPFGTEYISPQSHRRIHLIPEYDSAGNLFIGLDGDDLSGSLSLLFHLREDSSPGNAIQPSIPVWSYLAANGWQLLDNSSVRKDGTSGFISSGIIEIDLPADICRGHDIMPSEFAWLKVSVQSHPEALCSAYGIYTQALLVRRSLTNEQRIEHFDPIPSQSIKSSQISIPGITQISQPIPSFAGKQKETPLQLKTRAGERLRHKQRANVNWDYEHLILEQFPEIFMAKCFSAFSADSMTDETYACPGSVLIAVVPKPQQNSNRNLQPLADKYLLRDIRKYVQSISSPFARIEVRNPDYEQIHVRCSVKCNTHMTGDHLVTLNQAITKFLSPWEQIGLQTFFGWRIRSYDVESYIQHLDYIDYVTGFSMLRVASENGDRYLLEDTATGSDQLSPEFSGHRAWSKAIRAPHIPEDTSGQLLAEFCPTRPWSIAVPVNQHHIDIIDEPTSSPPKKTGVNDLVIGNTFILQ